MTLLSPNHNHAADECFAQIPQHHIPTQEEKIRASESFDKSVLVAAHMAALHDAYIMEMATHPVNEVTIKPASPTSSIGGLKPSALKQLKVGKVHRRRVLKGSLCSKTLCTKAHSGQMVVNVFEDEEGNATPIYLSNAMEGNGGSAQAQRYYPQDAKVAVKEPYLTRLPDGEVVLLVEKMTDLVFLWVPDYEEEDVGTKCNDTCEDKRETKETIDGGENGMPNGNPKDVGVDDLSDTEEHPKISNASRELKFDEVLDLKGSAENVRKQGDGVVQDNGNVSAIEEGANSSIASQEPRFEEHLSTGRGSGNVGFGDDSQSFSEIEGARPENDSDQINKVDSLDSNAIEEGDEVENKTRELEAEDILLTSKSDDTSHNVEVGANGQGLNTRDGECMMVAEVDGKGRAGADKVGSEDDVQNFSEVEGARPEDESGQIKRVHSEDSNATKKADAIETNSRDLETEDILVMSKSDASLNTEVRANVQGLKVADRDCSLVPEVDSNGREPEFSEPKGAMSETANEGLWQGKHLQHTDSREAASSLRVKGNAFFANGEYHKAIEMYKRGAEKAHLDNLRKEEVVCLSNRAEVWLRLCRNQAALDDAEAALRILKELEDDAADGNLALAKALFRKGRALMGLHKYEDAMCVLQEVLVKAPADRQLREAATRCKDRLQRVLKPGKRQRAAMNRRQSASFMVQ